MTNNADFGDFFHYVGFGGAIALMCIVGGLFTGALIYDKDKVAPPKNERDLYWVLQGVPTDNDNACQAATIIKKTTQQDKTMLEYLNSYQQLVSLKGSSEQPFYLDLFLKKNSEITRLIKGEKINLADSVLIPEWRTFWYCWGIYAYLCLVLGTTISFVAVSIMDGEGLLDWPWEELWVYPSILVMLPALAPCMAVELTYRIGKIGYSKLVVNQYRETVSANQADTIVNQAPVLSPDEILQEKKTKVQGQIQDATSGSNVERTKQQWLNFFLTNPDAETQRLNSVVRSSKDRLSYLGKEITETQRALAKAQQELVEREQDLKKEKQKSAADYLKDFEQLRALPHVAAIEIVDDLLTIYSDTIYIEYQQARYEIGIFAIFIRMATESLSLRNLCTTHPRGYDHPYAQRDSFCWGSLRDPINNALREKQYAVAVQYIIQALQSAAGDNPQAVTEWKKVRKNEKF